MCEIMVAGEFILFGCFWFWASTPYSLYSSNFPAGCLFNKAQGLLYKNYHENPEESYTDSLLKVQEKLSIYLHIFGGWELTM